MSAKPLGLADVQARLFELITARSSVADELAVQGLPVSHITDCIRGDSKLDAVARLDVYNSMYFLRLLQDVLQADYPTVLAVLGEAEFTALVSDYLQICRPNQPSVREASLRMPHFLESWITTRGAPAWLPQLAALEWARVDVFDEIDDAVLTMSHLAAIDSADLANIELRAITAHRCVHTTHDLAPLWRAADQGEILPPPEPGCRTLIVWRQEGSVYHRNALDDEQVFLSQLSQGFRFGDLCEQLGQQHDEASAARAAAQLVSSWVQDALLVAL